MAKEDRFKSFNIELKNIEGKKFRVMWSTKALYSVSASIVMIIMFIFYLDMITTGTFSINIYEAVPIIIFLTPFVLLTVTINNKFLGTIVAVINDNGIYTKNGLIPWNGIDSVRYKINIPFAKFTNKMERYCYLEIYSHNKQYIILHAPHKMIRYIKKNVPDVQVKKDKEFIIISVLSICLLFLIPFINKPKK